MVRGSAHGELVRLRRVMLRGVILYEYQLKERKNKMMNYKPREFYEKMFIAYIDECGLDSNMWNYCKAGLILFNIAKDCNFEWPTAFDDLPKGQMSAIVRDTVWKY